MNLKTLAIALAIIWLPFVVSRVFMTDGADWILTACAGLTIFLGVVYFFVEVS